MKPNPPIKGHELLYEGHTNRTSGPWWRSRCPSRRLSCGAQPPNFPNVSINQMKAWHRQHKEELRGHVVIADYGPLYRAPPVHRVRSCFAGKDCQVGVQSPTTADLDLHRRRIVPSFKPK